MQVGFFLIAFLHARFHFWASQTKMRLCACIYDANSEMRMRQSDKKMRAFEYEFSFKLSQVWRQKS